MSTTMKPPPKGLYDPLLGKGGTARMIARDEIKRKLFALPYESRKRIEAEIEQSYAIAAILKNLVRPGDDVT